MDKSQLSSIENEHKGLATDVAPDKPLTQPRVWVFALNTSNFQFSVGEVWYHHETQLRDQ